MAGTASDRIIEATFVLVAEHGLGSVTMTEVADRAGVARQTLYNHFSDVEQIIVTGIEQYAQTGFAQLVDLLEATGTAEAKMELLARYTVVEGDTVTGWRTFAALSLLEPALISTGTRAISDRWWPRSSHTAWQTARLTTASIPIVTPSWCRGCCCPPPTSLPRAATPQSLPPWSRNRCFGCFGHPDTR